MSFGYRSKRWVAAGDLHTPAGTPELYQAILLGATFTWVAAIRSSADSVFSSLMFRIVGSFIAGYFIVELFFFLLDWIFVDRLEIENFRRSLATLIVSSVEAALLFTVLLSLGGCLQYSYTPLGSAYNNWQYLLKLEVVPVTDSQWCEILAQSQWLLGMLLVGVIIASLLGPIVRPEREKNRSDLRH